MHYLRCQLSFVTFGLLAILGFSWELFSAEEKREASQVRAMSQPIHLSQPRSPTSSSTYSRLIRRNLMVWVTSSDITLQDPRPRRATDSSSSSSQGISSRTRSSSDEENVTRGWLSGVATVTTHGKNKDLLYYWAYIKNADIGAYKASNDNDIDQIEYFRHRANEERKRFMRSLSCCLTQEEIDQDILQYPPECNAEVMAFFFSRSVDIKNRDPVDEEKTS